MYLYLCMDVLRLNPLCTGTFLSFLYRIQFCSGGVLFFKFFHQGANTYCVIYQINPYVSQIQCVSVFWYNITHLFHINLFQTPTPNPFEYCFILQRTMFYFHSVFPPFSHKWTNTVENFTLPHWFNFVLNYIT